jgi:hypothetical protein
MNLETLKQHVRKVTPKEWQGQTVYLRKIGATEGVAMIAKIKAISSEELNEERDRKETVEYYAFAVSKSLANEAGDLDLDTDEGRTLLAQMNFVELCELGTLVLTHNGFAAEKKSTPTSNASLSVSALPLETSTAPTPTPCTLS